MESGGADLRPVVSELHSNLRVGSDRRLGADREQAMSGPAAVRAQALLQVAAPLGIEVGKDPLDDDGLGSDLILITSMAPPRPTSRKLLVHESGHADEVVELLSGPLGVGDIRHGDYLAAALARAASELGTTALNARETKKAFHDYFVPASGGTSDMCLRALLSDVPV